MLKGVLMLKSCGTLHMAGTLEHDNAFYCFSLLIDSDDLFG